MNLYDVSDEIKMMISFEILNFASAAIACAKICDKRLLASTMLRKELSYI